MNPIPKDDPPKTVLPDAAERALMQRARTNPLVRRALEEFHGAEIVAVRVSRETGQLTPK